MSKVTTEPFFFGQEDEIQIDPKKLPGSPQEQEEEQKSNLDTETKKQKEDVSIEDTKEEEHVDNSSFDFFGKPIEESKDNETVEEESSKKVTSEDVDYKGLTEYLVESGIWKDFEGREELEFNSETFQNLWKAQAENSAKEYIQEEKSQFGQAANQLLDYLKDGGTIEDFTSNYSQQLDIESIDLAEDSGQEQVVKEYYESIGWKPEKIKKFIEGLKDNLELKSEAEDCKTKLVEAIESERQEMIKEQEAIAQDRKLRVESFNKSVRESIYKDSDLADREKKELDKFIFEYNYQDSQGNRYSEFMKKMGEINQDPKKYQKFLKLIKNFDTVEDKKITEKETTKKNWNFLKQGSNPLEGVQSREPVKEKKTASRAFKFQ